MRRRAVVSLVAVVGAAAASMAAFAAFDGSTGTSSSQSPYLVASHDGVELRSIFTAGDPVGGVVDGYRLAGIPDGLGAIKDEGGSFTLLVNHEIASGGGVRAHGANGAFVSKWQIDKGDLSVTSGADLIQQIATWSTATGSYNAPAKGVALSRLCSADLPEDGVLYDKKSKAGYDGQLFMDGEEVGNEGRAFAHALDGTSYELPALGKFSHENEVTNPVGGAKTVVVGLDDTSPGGQVYVYVGEKKKTGNPAELAGLTGGKLYGIKVPGVPLEPAGAAAGIPSRTAFAAADLGNVTAKTGLQLQSDSATAGVTEWLRPEDGAWDPKHPNDFYFVTTAFFDGYSKLYRLRFADPANPALGGTVDQLLTGAEDGGTGQRYHMLDNIAIDRHGRIVLQEDPGNQAYVARVWLYDVKRGELTQIAQHDPVRFDPASITKLTQDEESSGVIDAEKILGKGWFLLDVQAHYAQPGPLVEGGQLVAMKVPKIHAEDSDDE
jgi:hypothetical protein